MRLLGISGMTGAPRWIQFSEKDFEPMAEAIGRGNLRDATARVAALFGAVLGRPIVSEVPAAVVGAARRLLQIRPNQCLEYAEKQSDTERAQPVELAKLLYIVTMQALAMTDSVQAQRSDQLEAILFGALRPLVENNLAAGSVRH
jgi:hypothetical protein